MPKQESLSALSPTPKHPIQVVARRTGLSTDVIRAWERRYHAIQPARTSNSRRLYSDADVSKLLLLNRATTAGRRIGDVADLDPEALTRLIATDETAAAHTPAQDSFRPSTGSVMEHFEECLEAIELIDPTTLRTALANATHALGIPFLLEDLVRPLLHHIQEECRRGRMRLVQETLAISLIRSYLWDLTASTEVPKHAPTLVVATLAGQSLELVAIRLAVTAHSYDWNSVYLGPDMPADEIAFAVERTHASAVAIGIVQQVDNHHLPNELRKLRYELPPAMPVFVEGNAASGYQEVITEIEAHWLQSLGELRLELDRLQQPKLAEVGGA